MGEDGGMQPGKVVQGGLGGWWGGVLRGRCGERMGS